MIVNVIKKSALCLVALLAVSVMPSGTAFACFGSDGIMMNKGCGEVAIVEMERTDSMDDSSWNETEDSSELTVDTDVEDTEWASAEGFGEDYAE